MLTIPLSLLAAHFVGDFLLQSNWMALNKSKLLVALTTHVAVYSCCFLWWGWEFVAITILTHLCTDLVTSKWTSKLWFIDLKPTLRRGQSLISQKYDEVFPFDARLLNSKRHWFFVVIGLDQLIHATTLALTWRFLFGG